MAGTPGIVREGQKYFSQEESEGAAMMTAADDISQAYTIEGLGGSVNAPSESDMGLRSISIGNQLTVDDGISENKVLTMVFALAIIYFVFIKKGKRK